MATDDVTSSPGLERIKGLCAELRHHNRDYRVELCAERLTLLYNNEPKMTGDESTLMVFLENELAKFLGGPSRAAESDNRTPLASGVEYGGGGIFYGPPAGSTRHF